MGNCQAIDAATLVVQHPSGKVDKYYWAVSASEIMKMNPGHYVALLLSTTLYPTSKNAQCPPDNTAAVAVTTKNSDNNSVRITRIKLLKPTDTLVLGHVYRLITTQEVMKGLWAKKQSKNKKDNPESADKTYPDIQIIKRSQTEKDYHLVSSSRRKERIKAKTITGNNSGCTSNATARSKTTWQPSLQSISEAVR